VALGPTLTYAISTTMSWDHLTSFGLRDVGGRPGTKLEIGVTGVRSAIAHTVSVPASQRQPVTSGRGCEGSG
jgi:hypothetical protein